MMTLSMLSVISGSQILNALIWIVCLGVVFWLVNWFLGYVGLPEPFAKVARVLVGLVVLVVLINIIMGIAGHPFINW